MTRTKVCLGVYLCVLLLVLAAAAQEEVPAAAAPPEVVPEGAVPRLVRFSGVLQTAYGEPRSGLLGVTFALYREQAGGAPLWVETQNVEVDAEGRYTVLLGATRTEGVPADLFTAGEARWLGIQVKGEKEQRVLLVSVPYALKAGDAETLGGKPASAFVQVSPDKATLPPSQPANALGGLAPFYTATSTTGPSLISLATSGPPLSVASTALVSNLNADMVDGMHASDFGGDITGVNTAAGSGLQGGAASGEVNLSLLTCPDTQILKRSGSAWLCAIDLDTNSGGTVTQVNSGMGLTGGPITTTGTLSIDTGVVPQLGAANIFTGLQTFGGARLPATGTADVTQGFNSQPVDWVASAFRSDVGLPVAQTFRWQAEPVSNNSPSASGKLSLLFAAGAVAPAPTGLSISATGTLTAPAFIGDGSGLTNLPAGTANDLACAGCVGSADLAGGAVTEPKLSFDPATQTELNAHKSSDDHAATYVNVAGDTMTGALSITAAGTGLSVTNNAQVNGNVGIGTAPVGTRALAVSAVGAEPAGEFSTSGAVTINNLDGALKVQNSSTNTTTDGITKVGLSILSSGAFTGLAGAATANRALTVSASGADINTAGQFITSGAVTINNLDGALRVQNSSTNTTTDGIAKAGLSIDSTGTFTGLGGTPTINRALDVVASGADINTAGQFTTSGAVTSSNGEGALKVQNLSTNTTTDAISKLALSILSSGAFTGLGGSPTRNSALAVSASGADVNTAGEFITSGAVTATNDDGALRVENSSTNTTTDNITKVGLSILSSGAFTGLGGAPTINKALTVSASGADVNLAADLSSDGVVAEFNRNLSDGVLLQWQRDGANVGEVSVAGGTVSYGAFTGSHYAWTNQAIERGMLVTLTGQNKSLGGRPAAEPIYGIEVSSRANDPAILGAYLGRQEPSAPDEPVTENPHLVMAVGNGEMWVVDTGEDIRPGDALISSHTPGHAMKDSDRFEVSYVVARAAEPVRWSEVTETVNGVKHKRISILFDAQVREKATVLAARLAATQGELAELRQALAARTAELAELKAALRTTLAQR